MTQLNLKGTVKPINSENQEEQKVAAFVDYYDVQKYVPDNFYKKVWIDNLSFMFEKHISHKSFFSFLHEVANSIDIPSLTDEACIQKGFYPDY